MCPIRDSKKVGSTTYEYITQNGQVVRQTGGGHTLDFVYDNQGRPMTLVYDGIAYTYMLNLQGDVIALLNSSGGYVATYVYDAWGKVLSSTGTLAEENPLRYRGYYYDTESELYYLGSRYYDPAVKRFINADGYASTGNGFIGYNMFAYCNNAPICFTDSTGSRPIASATVSSETPSERAASCQHMKGTKKGKTPAVPSGIGKKAGTFSTGVNVAAAWGGGFYGSIGVAADTHGNVGIVVSYGGGGGTPSASLSRYRTITNAPTIYELGGMSMQAGGSFELGISVGGEYTLFQDTITGDIYQGGTISGGVGLPGVVLPVELHGEVGNSYVIGFNIMDMIDRFGEWLNEVF